MIDPFTKLFSLILCFFILNVPFGSFGCGGGTETDRIAQNIENGILEGTLSPFSGPDVYDGEVILSLTAEDENGGLYFADIDYKNGDRTTWPAARHITRAERLAILYKKEADPEKKEAYKNAVLGLIDHWIKADYQNSNWWHNRLSGPNILGEIGILMKDDLNKQQLLKLSELVGRGCFTVSPVLYSHAGANAVDLAMSSIKFGALTGSGNAVKTAVNIVSGELKYSLAEGLKKDHTFFQHGNRIYMGGYGVEYITGMTEVIAMLDGSGYNFTAEQFEPFVSFILDGMRKMSFGSTLDPTTMGRSVSRVNAQPLKSIVGALNKLACVEEMPRKEELAAFAQSITNNVKQNYGLEYFDVAKFLVINNEDFYFSFRGGSDTLVYSEIINDENVLGYNSSFPGVTTVMHTGSEYTDVAPIYDYSFVPGSTAVYETDEQLRAHADFTYRILPGTYCEASVPGAAALGAKTTHEGISMTVSCFATDNAAIILGAGMKDSKGRAMNTTLDQCRYAGSFERDGNTVTHNGIKYTVYSGGALSAAAEHRTGNWKRNNLTYPDIFAEGDMFTVSLENNGSYAYSVMSENTDAEFEIIVNTENVQAVKLPDGRIAAAFFANTSFDYNGNTYSGKTGDAGIY